MDCCANKNQDSNGMKGGKSKMEKNIILWVAIGALFLAVLFLTFKASALSAGTGAAIASSGGKLDTTGWTQNEIMNYEMHGTIPARAQKGSAGAASSSSAMVGGC